MKYLKELSPLKRFMLEGSVRGIISTIPSGVLFLLIYMIFFIIKNKEIELGSFAREYLPVLILFFYILILSFSFLPATVGGAILANWIYQSKDISKKSGMVKGGFIGGLSMFGFMLLIGILSLTLSHGPSISLFLFYTTASAIIAAIAGVWVGVQLTNKMVKNYNLV